jgi:hypothetical protein
VLSKIAGWTALVLIVILVIAAQFFNLGKLFHRLLWLGVIGVAAVGAINEWRR